MTNNFETLAHLVERKRELEDARELEDSPVGVDHLPGKLFGLRSEVEASESFVVDSGSGVLEAPAADLRRQVVDLVVLSVPDLCEPVDEVLSYPVHSWKMMLNLVKWNKWLMPVAYHLWNFTEMINNVKQN